MRIPLDYYRILGLPIQATAEQLKQSHRDRTLQVPRREYSELAIESRRQLIDLAYSVLGDSMRRAEYDQEFLAASKSLSQSLAQGAGQTEDLDAHVPSIEIEDHQLVGGLLILLELGEYELVLRLGRAHLKRDDSTPEGQQLKAQPALPDIILSLAVACLELGREEWQQNHYEHAAESLETGRELLLREDLFPVLRAEIQSDLYKLRPYRCLELIARPLEQKQPRQEGVNLLRGMLQDRGGIDGADDDLSGLGVDDFLRFVQQLRGYLTAAEQQEVFEAEAQRPSAVGTYLAVYALLARGFAQHQPALIRRAKQMLLRLSGRQDVHLEQAVCAVLLGQTEEASRALELSQEYEPLAFIREHSQGSPDLLPGLCLYAENWLQQEVFPFFRDLDQAPATLKDYFADSSVQTFLENLPLANERSNRQSSWAQSSQETERETFSERSAASPALTAASFGQSSAPAESDPTYEGPFTLGKPGREMGLGDRPFSASDTGNVTSNVTGLGQTANLSSVAEKISQLSPSGQLVGNSVDQSEPPARSRENTDSVGGTALRARRSRRPSPKWGRLAAVILAGLLCLGLAGILAMRVIGLLGSSSSPEIEGEPLDIEINQPPIETESPDAAAAPSPADAAGIAETTITQWLETKQAAYASDYDSSGLEDVLTGSALSRSQGKVQTAQADDWYVDYTHGDVKVLSVEPEDATDADQLSVEAEVTESATFYEAGQRVDQYSYTDDVVTIGYDLVRQDGQWLIEQFR
ncbi:MAG: IMS domain-containing protein [Phormidesmis sp.]